MTKPTINRGSYMNFYDAANFNLSIPKKDKKAEVLLSYVIGNPNTESSNYQFSTVFVSRRQAVNALKNFKKVLAKSRQRS